MTIFYSIFIDLSEKLMHCFSKHKKIIKCKNYLDFFNYVKKI